MAGKKDQSVIATITGLTSTQAANIQRDIIKSKDKHAPSARGTMVKGLIENVGSMLAAGVRNMLPAGNKPITKKTKAKGGS